MILVFGVGSGGMPGAFTLKECATLEIIIKKQAADCRLYAAIYASPVVCFWIMGLLKGLKLSSIATTAES
ncbi:hypothetical protein OROMI_007004 [Orobanche minor]